MYFSNSYLKNNNIFFILLSYIYLELMKLYTWTIYECVFPVALQPADSWIQDSHVYMLKNPMQLSVWCCSACFPLVCSLAFICAFFPFGPTLISPTPPARWTPSWTCTASSTSCTWRQTRTWTGWSPNRNSPTSTMALILMVNFTIRTILSSFPVPSIKLRVICMF